MSTVSNTMQFERRAWPRLKLDRPCKVYDVRARKYVPATARDISRGGVLVELVRHFSLAPGDPIEVGVSRADDALLPARGMLEGVVLRADRQPGDCAVLAVRFTAPCELHEPVPAVAA